MIAARTEPPRGYLHQGAIFIGVPILWYSRTALVLRPKDEPSHDRLSVIRASEDPSSFQRDDLTVASAKKRPVIVMSARREIKNQNTVRVVALYPYHEGGYLARAKPEIERGEVASMLHVAGEANLGMHDSVIDLSQILRVPKDVFEGSYLTGVREAASLADPSLALMLTRLRAYLTIMDRGRVV